MRLKTGAFLLNAYQLAAGVDVWCGKAYRAGDVSFDPGGWLSPPLKSEVPLLNLQVYPRKSIYLADEDVAQIVIDAEITHDVGEPYCQLRRSSSSEVDTASGIWFVEFTFESLGDDGGQHDFVYIKPNTTGNEASLQFRDLAPRLEPYVVDVTLKSPDCLGTYSSQFHIYLLPLPDNGGSVVRLDYLYGGLEVRNGIKWKQIFPFGFYADWGGYLRRQENQDEYASLGYSVVSPVPAGGDEPFEPEDFTAYVARADQGEPSIMYNMRWTYKNDALVTKQVEELKKHSSMLLWYTADEPGGQGDPLDAPLKSYDVIKKIDPYHPVSLVLNCANFHYAEYTRGADIILTDPYPIAVNTSWSSRWNTECNTTYGCCGCDNCNGNFRDVSIRLGNFKKYQRWLSNAPLGQKQRDPGHSAGGPKASWGVPQVFGGSEYWDRPPTASEEIVMIWLFINHGAKGIVGWLFPTTSELTSAMSNMADIVTNEGVTALLLGDNPRPLEVVVEADVDIDAAAWIVGNQMLVSIVYLGLTDTDASVIVKLPKTVQAESTKQLWPPIDRDYVFDETVLQVQGESPVWHNQRARPLWNVNGSEAKRLGMSTMAVSILTIDLAE